MVTIYKANNKIIVDGIELPNNNYIISEPSSGKINVYDEDLDTYILYNIDFTEITDQNLSTFLTTILAIDYLNVVFSKTEKRQLVYGSGRFYLYTDLRWISEADDNYGTNTENRSESAGTGVNPVFEWEHLGKILPAGRKLKSLNFACRANNSQVTDLEIYIVAKRASTALGYKTGVDNDNEVEIIDIYRGLYKAGSDITAPLNDKTMKVINLNDFSLDTDCFYSIYLKPVGALTSTRYLLTTYVWEIE